MKNAEIEVGREYAGKYGGRFKVIGSHTTKLHAWSNVRTMVFDVERRNIETGEPLEPAITWIAARDLRRTWEEQAAMDKAREDLQAEKNAVAEKVIRKFAQEGLIIDRDDITVREKYISVKFDRDEFEDWTVRT